MTGEAAVIGRFDVRWLAAAGVDTRRLEGLVADLLDGPLEAALADAGLPASSDVCIRRVDVAPLRLRLDGPDRAFVDEWSRAIGRAVGAAVAGGDVAAGGQADAVVVYRSPAHAVADLLLGTVASDLSRVWAWRQMGLWLRSVEPSPRAALEAAVAALRAEPSLIAGAVAAVAAAGRLETFLRYFAAELPALAAAAWAAVGGAPIDGAGGGAPAGDMPAGADPAGSDRADRARARAHDGARAVARSPLAAAVAPLVAAEAARPLRLPLAMLAVAFVEPADASRPGAASLVRTVACLLGGESAGDPASPTAPGPGQPPSPPSAERAATGPAASARPLDPPGPAHGDRTPVAGSVADPTATTGWGGLPFLLHVVADLGWPAAVDHGLRSLLHGVALAVTERAAPDAAPTRPDDPALLAFAGLAAGADPPDPPDTPARHDEVVGLTDNLVDGLRARLVGSPLAGAPEAALLVAVCRRRARIVADPGWIEVHLDLDEVSVDVRAAGLDLDPGFVPWLGCVVGFRYG